MIKIKSIADYINKCNENVHYKKAIVIAFKKSFYYREKEGQTEDDLFVQGMNWVNKWSEENIGKNKKYCNCSSFVYTINDAIADIPNWQNL